MNREEINRLAVREWASACWEKQARLKRVDDLHTHGGKVYCTDCYYILTVYGVPIAAINRNTGTAVDMVYFVHANHDALAGCVRDFCDSYGSTNRLTYKHANA